MGRIVGIVALSGLALGVVVAAVVTIGYLLLIANFGDCAPPERKSSSLPQMIRLDVEHPIAEQRAAVDINAEALPTDLPPDAVTIGLEPEWTVIAPGAPSGPGTGSDATNEQLGIGSELQVMFVREDLNQVGARIGVPETNPEAHGLIHFPRITLDCDRGQACHRAYRVVFVWPHPRQGMAVSVTWSVSATAAYAKAYATCGPPENARVALEAQPPVLGGVDRMRHAEAAARSEHGTIVARHITIRSETDSGTPGASLPAVAWARLNVREPAAEPDQAWSMWVRILDDHGALLADGPLGQAYSPIQDFTIDFPVPADCGGADSCERGFWLIFQSFATAPPLEPPLEPPDLGEFAWSIETTYETPPPLEPPSALVISIDKVPEDLAARSLMTSLIPVSLEQTDIPRSVEVAVAIDARPPHQEGLDPLAAALAIVHVDAHGPEVQTHVDGDGAGPLRGYANGDGRINLIAHPFDGCAADGPCRGVIRLVAVSGSGHPTGAYARAQLTWSLTLLNAPAGTRFTVGAPIDGPSQGGNQPLGGLGVPILAIGLTALTLLVAADLSRRERRRART
jgi:hypothetical protein